MHNQEDDPTMTECNDDRLEFHALGKREVVGRFDGGAISSDGGALLLSEVEAKTRIVAQLAEQFVDHRNPALIEHSVRELIAQRVFALALGYEDLNDHDLLRFDPLLAAAVGKLDPTGQNRVQEQDRGKALASSRTLNRLELTPENATSSARYKKIVADPAGMDRLMVGLFLDAFATPPEEIVLDLDATDDPLHGTQEGRHFHAFYDCYCYLPLYIFCGEHILCARLRSSDVEAAHGCVEELARIVAQIRARWPDVRIVVRGDSGFCRDALMTWCEAEGVDFVLGLQKNSRLLGFSVVARAAAHIGFLKSREPTRVFTEFEYSTRDSWSRARRVVAKAEHSAQGPNPRYVVTSLPAERADPRTLYEDWYCARGDMENRIKEQQLDLFADRTSTHTLRANQIRLYFSSFAYALLCALRRLGLADTELATAQCGTLRVRLLKVGAQVRVSVRKVWIAFSESFPAQAIFIRALRNIRAAPPGFSIA
jgi:hypothetical protein